MGDTLERGINVLGGLLLITVVGIGVAELTGYVDVFTLSEFLVLFFGVGISMTVLRWWAS